MIINRPFLRASIVSSICYLGVLFILISCKGSTGEPFPTPKEYDLNHPFKMNLPEQLNEISGIVYYPKDTAVFAISDATGWLYKIFLKKNMAVQKWKFGKNDDYEDLQLVDSTFYVLGSPGDITRIKFISKDSLNVEETKFPEKGNEFESLYFDHESGSLHMICKDCEADKKKTVGTWAFYPNDNSYQLSSFMIDVSPIARNFGLEKIKFKPSAAAVNPLTNQLYVLSSVNKALIVADKTGQVKEVYALDPSIYKQPEGIAFTPAGDMLISNESAQTGSANILILKIKKAN